jgi:hypothetical protein
MTPILTAEQIVAEAEKKSDTSLGQRRAINRLFRMQDDSNLWPVNGRYNVIARAIRHANIVERANGMMSNLEYALFLENDESQIVNDPKNW